MNKKLFGAYLKGKYDFISKFDMLTQEKEARQYHHLSLREAIEVWNGTYNDN